ITAITAVTEEPENNRLVVEEDRIEESNIIVENENAACDKIAPEMANVEEAPTEEKKLDMEPSADSNANLGVVEKIVQESSKEETVNPDTSVKMEACVQAESIQPISSNSSNQPSEREIAPEAESIPTKPEPPQKRTSQLISRMHDIFSTNHPLPL